MDDEPLICEPGGGGLILPLFGDDEQRWDPHFRMVIYLLGLLWTFLGVAIVADIFMAAIEQITSKTKAVETHDGNGESRTYYVQVWNGTVANLTLMALGSSAPEILLSVIEVSTNNFFSGSLGPSTIVGSAAFNLMVIIAVCVSAIPTGEARTIENVSVFGITASFSLLAYLWLALILLVSTPDIVTPAEGLVTFALFPVLVILAYLMDIGWFSRKRNWRGYAIGMNGLLPTAAEMSRIVAEIKSRFPSTEISADVLSKMVQHEVQRRVPKSRAYWRVDATRRMVGGRRVHVPDDEVDLQYDQLMEDGGIDDTDEEPRTAFITFSAGGFYSVTEGDKEVVLTVLRDGYAKDTIKVFYRTVDDTATAGADYQAVEGVLTFKPDERSKQIKVPIIDDDEVENDEYFYVKLTKVEVVGRAAKAKKRGGPPAVELKLSRAMVTVVDNDKGGVFVFEQQSMRVKDTDKEVVMRVVRREGTRGRATVDYHTSDGKAIAYYDYTHTSGRLTFDDHELFKEIRVPIVPTSGYDDKEEEFFIHLTNPSEGTALDTNQHGKPSEKLTATVVIVNDSDLKRQVDTVSKLLTPVNHDKVRLGYSLYTEQFRDAVRVRSDDDESPPSVRDWIGHIVALPWKILFAICPPTMVCDGLACFAVALTLIGVVTAIIGDLAGLLGCVMGIPDAITAITFVALGTSLPDTFASIASAKGEPYADSSLGNVTGSNSVNVFLGLGMPWSLGALYWSVQGATPEWSARYPDLVLKYPNGGFAVPAGDLGYSVTVFSFCATVTILTVLLRRRVFGAELGGPEPYKTATSVFFVGLWLLYVSLSTIKTLGSGTA